MRVLDLFSGTGSVSKVCKELGWEVISVDISDKFHVPTFKIDILDFDFKQYPVGYFDIIWSSPPCRTFSGLMNIHKPKHPEGWLEKLMETEGLPPLRKTQEIIEYLKPRYYFIENPSQSRMKHYLDLPSYVVSYCQYGFLYQKNTRIWTNKSFKGKVCTKKSCKYYGKHLEKIGLTRAGTSKKIRQIKRKYQIPPLLIKELFRTTGKHDCEDEAKPP